MNDSEANTDTNIAALFNADDYLYFFQDLYLSDERERLEAQFILSHLDIGKETSVLDLACGHGRHATFTAKVAKNVVGVDINSRFLEIAQQRAKSEGITNISYIHGDARKIRYRNEFDRVTLLNTVFGLFSDAENSALLSSMHRALKPSGRICVDVINRDTILVDFKPHGIVEKNGDVALDRLSFNPRSGRMSNRRTYIRNGHRCELTFSLRLYNLTEVCGLLEAAGFKIVGIYADWKGSSIDQFSKKFFLLAEKTDR